MKNDTIDFMELKWSNNGVPYKNNEKVFTGYTGPFPKATGHEFDGLKKALEQDENLWVDRKIILEELHNLVKEHPFRTNNDNKYLVSYLKLLDKFFKEFRKGFEDLANKQYVGLDMMTHDLNATLWKCKKCKTITPIQLQYLEAGLTVYHHYMEYKECPCFYVLSKEIIYCHQWSKKYQKYFLKLSDKEKYLKMQKDLRKLWGKTNW